MTTNTSPNLPCSRYILLSSYKNTGAVQNFKIIEYTPKWDESSRQEREGFGTGPLQQTLAPKGLKRKREIMQCFVPCKSVMLFKE